MLRDDRHREGRNWVTFDVECRKKYLFEYKEFIWKPLYPSPTQIPLNHACTCSVWPVLSAEPSVPMRGQGRLIIWFTRTQHNWVHTVPQHTTLMTSLVSLWKRRCINMCSENAFGKGRTDGKQNKPVSQGALCWNFSMARAPLTPCKAWTHCKGLDTMFNTLGECHFYLKGASQFLVWRCTNEGEVATDTNQERIND